MGSIASSLLFERTRENPVPGKNKGPFLHTSQMYDGSAVRDRDGISIVLDASVEFQHLFPGDKYQSIAEVLRVTKQKPLKSSPSCLNLEVILTSVK